PSTEMGWGRLLEWDKDWRNTLKIDEDFDEDTDEDFDEDLDEDIDEE
ncbi:hypothetical protein KIPB_014511, partial [Kipferlia bialata]